ncbi:MAG: Rrf2 family transcriptional regulator [Thermodesulfobacteriota bacterium]|nr:Rrf2 family transcriptional regulator [Thermodesulfobacteriota bacterium]
MKITRKGEYAMRALVDLAQNYRKGLRQIQDIVREEEIPGKFLEQILIILKNAGLLQSKRGIGGGYSLNRPPDKISIGEVIRLIDGPLAPLGCVSSGHASCSKEITCGIRSVMVDVENATAEILDRVTLADICNRTKGMAERRAEYQMYYI